MESFKKVLRKIAFGISILFEVVSTLAALALLIEININSTGGPVFFRAIPGVFLLGIVAILIRRFSRNSVSRLVSFFEHCFFLFPFILYAMIALPSMSRYQSKARQSEAKIALAAIFGGERAYFQEYKTYTASLEKIGYAPEGNRRFYMVGFPDACAPKAVVAQFRTRNSIYASENEAAIIDFFRSIKECPDPKNGFEAYAVGYITPEKRLDVWKINQDKKLINVKDGQ